MILLGFVLLFPFDERGIIAFDAVFVPIGF